MSLLSRAKKLIAPKKKEDEKPEEKVETRASSDIAKKIGLVPLMTEKGMKVQAQSQTAIFQVKANASKFDVARAIFEQHEVKPLAVRTVNMRGKIRRRGNVEGSTSAWKKAYVKVKDVEKLMTNYAS